MTKKCGDQEFMHEAIVLSELSVNNDGGPFGAVVVRNGVVVGRGSNTVTLHNDPTAHAEVNAIRAACSALGSFRLEGCELYTSCEPCPMCLSAAYWAGISTVYYGNTRCDAAAAGFDDAWIYDQIPLPWEHRTLVGRHIMANEALHAFEMWGSKQDKIKY